MQNIKILDCTLRDGGYINNWNFKKLNIIRTINSLNKANIDIIECGYLSERKESNKDNTFFANIEEIDYILKKTNSNSLHAIMINYGEYDVNKIPNKNEINTKVDAIRLAFKKDHWKNAMKDVKILCEKGYKIFLQPMVILGYKDEEILELIKECNKLDIYSFYIVDSFGAMKNKDISRLSYIIDHNLKKGVSIGYHGHNNLQLAYSNAVEFINACRDRELILDASVFGMGRGAGNLPSELICNYLNSSCFKNYNIEDILHIIDSYIYDIYMNKYWGYSPAHYLSGIYNCHPNYSTFLINKKTLTVSDMECILRGLDEDKKVVYDKDYIENFYIRHNSKALTEKSSLKYLKENLKNKNIYLLAPGKSLIKNLDKIDKKNSIIITVNYDLNNIEADYCFFSNKKRYIEFKDKLSSGYLIKRNREIILTSNIDEKGENVIKVDYNSILGISDTQKDNSMIMILNLLNHISINKVFIIGFDGFKDIHSYYEESMEYNIDEEDICIKNDHITKEILELRKYMNIEFLTESLYDINSQDEKIII